MSNNPPLPPPDMDDFEATMIREDNPLPQSRAILKGGPGYPTAPKPRRAKPNSHIWTYIALGAWFAVAGFIGAFLGTVLANIL